MPGRRERRKHSSLVEQLELLAGPEGTTEETRSSGEGLTRGTAGNAHGNSGEQASRRRAARKRPRGDAGKSETTGSQAAVSDTGKARASKPAATRGNRSGRARSQVAATAAAGTENIEPAVAGARRARAQVAATAVTAPGRRRKKRSPKWGEMVAIFLVLALSGLAAYNQGLLDKAVAWVTGTDTGSLGQGGVPGQQGAQGTPDQTGSTGETGGSGEHGPQGPRGEASQSGEPGEPGQPGEKGEPGQSGGLKEPGQTGDQSDSLAPMEMALSARALYLTMDTAGTPSRMASIMKYMRSHEGLNSFVIDIKDNNGRVPTRPPEHIPARAGSYSQLPGLIEIIADLDYYMIGRIVAFQDPYRAQQEPERAIRRADGSLWRDRDGRLWLNPYDKKNWEFVRDVALWAVDMGFHEIQLDYVRFPDSARGLEKSGAVLMPGYEEYETRGDCIAAFLDYMSEALEGKAYLGADIFGFATIASDDMGIGHKWEQLADSVDFMCPMVYPSHYYNPGICGFQLPEPHPYEVVYKAMAEALERSEGLRSKTRPWLQDFSMRVKYGPEEVSGQIRATFEHGIKTYMLWNPANYYTDGVEYVPEVEVSSENPGTG
ncbi:MAG: hypothetical protein GX863_04470 [Firmicutes bacterium]|nr:hypothetical protein [Candidatus Fermentithermobacillaceae bacterium]